MNNLLSGGQNVFQMFQQFDRNGDGKITEEDFVIALRGLGLGGASESTARYIFKQLDSNRNGKLDMSEAMVAFEKLSHLLPKQNATHA